MTADEINQYLNELNHELRAIDVKRYYPHKQLKAGARLQLEDLFWRWRMITLKETKALIGAEPQWWKIHLMNFVDDFRYHKDMGAVSEPFEVEVARMDALLASTAEALCDELKQEPPLWLASVPACRQPYFVSGVESLKAITLVESPLRFRIRKIFVMENFLSRA